MPEPKAIVLDVVHIEREESMVRIISARRATRQEQAYDESTTPPQADGV